MTSTDREHLTVRNGARATRRLRWIALAATALGWIGLGAGFAVDPRRAFYAYLGAFVYGVTVAVGALALLMIGHAVGAKWFVVVRRVTESVAGTLPLFLLLFAPLVFGLDNLYPWVRPVEGTSAHVREVLEAKRSYLNVPFFVARSFVYLSIWSALALALRGWSLRQDRDPEAAPFARAVAWSGPGLLVLGFTVSFAAFDWVMSLDPVWFSTVFGLYVAIGGTTAALGLLLVLARGLERSGPLDGVIAAPHYHALGRLLLACSVLWAYLAYSQGFLIWIADLPHEVEWLIVRLRGGWAWATAALVAGRFAIPFAFLLSREIKRSGRRLAAIGAWALVFHWLDVFWLVMPSLGHGAAAPHWLDMPALLAVVGPAMLFAGWQLEGRAVLPLHDPRLAQALEYQSP